jgi:hypothetical protein
MEHLLLEQRIFQQHTESSFRELCMDMYRFQLEKSPIYKRFTKLLQKPEAKSVEEIPFMPIEFFKHFDIRCHCYEPSTVFLSSGTTGSIRSKHSLEKPELYVRSFLSTYETQVGKLEDQIILALLPNYVQQGNSSLVYMVDYLIQQTQHPLSGFYLNDVENIQSNYEKARKEGKKVVIFGVSYALLDLAEKKVNLSDAFIIETGGMKGRRKELTKEELHEILKEGLQVPFISSEYGMTELLSQAYSLKDGMFTLPPWMRVFIRETNDPFQFVDSGKTGGINVIDLANLYSCSFIATQDLGQIYNDKLKLLGRFDQADIRGCNLLVD